MYFLFFDRVAYWTYSLLLSDPFIFFGVQIETDVMTIYLSYSLIILNYNFVTMIAFTYLLT